MKLSNDTKINHAELINWTTKEQHIHEVCALTGQWEKEYNERNINKTVGSKK